MATMTNGYGTKIVTNHQISKCIFKVIHKGIKANLKRLGQTMLLNVFHENI